MRPTDKRNPNLNSRRGPARIEPKHEQGQSGPETGQGIEKPALAKDAASDVKNPVPGAASVDVKPARFETISTPRAAKGDDDLMSKPAANT